ncbi:phosphodiester glycosidase family protein [Phormidesmis priestleyi]|nr:phosphodiester glycosidase family protein [Phormidesmis priestleyi]
MDLEQLKKQGMIDRAFQQVLMQSRVKSDRRRRAFHFFASCFGSISAATGSFLFLSTVLFPIQPPTISHPSLLLADAIKPDQLKREPVDFSVPARPIAVNERHIAGTAIYVTTIDLTDPKTFVSVELANRATQANSARSTQGDEAFLAIVRRAQAAITANGTFFSTDAQKRVMGNLVSGGKFLKYSPWENYGTTLGLRSSNRPEMTTARIDGKPRWQQHWFSLTAGPRLLKRGEIWLNPKQEGFTDRAVMGVAVRAAIGFPEHGKRLLLVTFRNPVSLKKEAAIMKSLGCHEAMNLDGGTSLALAQGGKILRSAGRPLTNVIAIYDTDHPAPNEVQRSWLEFQQSQRAALPKGEE